MTQNQSQLLHQQYDHYVKECKFYAIYPLSFIAWLNKQQSKPTDHFY